MLPHQHTYICGDHDVSDINAVAPHDEACFGEEREIS
jgi:hypothetical protein